MKKLLILAFSLALLFGCGKDGKDGTVTVTLVPPNLDEVVLLMDQSTTMYLGCLVDTQTGSKGWCFFYLYPDPTWVDSHQLIDPAKITLLAATTVIHDFPAGEYLACITHGADTDCINSNSEPLNVSIDKGEKASNFKNGADGTDVSYTVTFGPMFPSVAQD